MQLKKQRSAANNCIVILFPLHNPINVQCYPDNGYSGLTLDRPALNDLVSAIHNGKAAVVIVKDKSRIARDWKLVVAWRDVLSKCGVKFQTLNEADDDYRKPFAALRADMR
ncbi:MAG: recombinase family protein [Oscillospiraceae bacterium]|jgi:DNA invertase Pin-like site-specific DNA recombinase|nr:recombinase family protein [Oscillospiraceae bacterium]